MATVWGTVSQLVSPGTVTLACSPRELGGLAVSEGVWVRRILAESFLRASRTGWPT